MWSDVGYHRTNVCMRVIVEGDWRRLWCLGCFTALWGIYCQPPEDLPEPL